MAYGETEKLPFPFVIVLTLMGFASPWIVAALMSAGLITPQGVVKAPIGLQFWGVGIGIICGALIAPLLLVYGLLYLTDYWRVDVEKTKHNPVVVIIALTFPIAFALTVNTSVGLYVGVPFAVALILTAILYDFEPRVPTSVAMPYALFWSSITTIAVSIGVAGVLYGFNFHEWFLASSNPRAYLASILNLTTLDVVYPYLATSSSNTGIYLISVLFSAFVVGFVEEAYARLSIPMLAKYYGLFMAVVIMGAMWLFMHVVPITAESMNLYATVVNVFFLALISWFVFYTFARTGDYVSVGLAHGMYDALVGLGFYGLVVAVVLAVATARYANLGWHGY